MVKRLFIISILCLLVPGISSLQAQWVENGTGICMYTANQYDPRICSDGSGGAIITWEDSRVSGNDIYAQRINAYGKALWTIDGVVICSQLGTQYDPVIASDGEGGAIIAWPDQRVGNVDIYAQKVDADGVVQWTSNGVAVCTTSESQYGLQLVSDGSGGAIFVWQDERYGDYDIFAQRIDAGGTAQWLVDGITVCGETNIQGSPQLIADGFGGAIIAWDDLRSATTYDIYAQRVNAGGSTLWTSGGRSVCTEIDHQIDPRLIMDGAGAALITWTDDRNGTNDLYAQRLELNGTSLWTSGGIAITTASGNQWDPKPVSDGALGAIIVWEDYRNGNADIYAQRIDPVGAVLWTANGVLVCDASGHQYDPKVVSDGVGGAIITWEDRRYLRYDIFAQRIDAAGTGVWTTNGVALCTAGFDQSDPYITGDGEGGGIITWEDSRIPGDINIHAQRIDRDGYWGYPCPVISEVADVPGDQGGLVNVTWDASRLDTWPDDLINEYTVWRAIPEVSALLLKEAGAHDISSYFNGEKSPVLNGLSLFDADRDTPVIRRAVTGAGTYYWELIATVEAYQLGSYAKASPTLFDSTTVSAGYSYFQVIVHTRDPNTYWISAPDSGYSVDNLAPCPPLCLAGEQSYSPEGLEITWTPNTEPDLDSYNIYRGADPGFSPGSGNLIASPCDTLYFDGDWRWDNTYCYKVAAVDVHGNESEYTLLCSDEVTGGDTPVTPQATFLEQNYPNPFNPVTRVIFGLDAPAQVSLRIYDGAGRLVRVLVEAERPAGTYEMMWDGRDNSGLAVASGVYFYRLTAGSFTETRKMVLMR